MHKHDGKRMPCDPKDVVKVKQRNGDFDEARADKFGWVHRLGHDGKPWPGDIVEWQVTDEWWICEYCADGRKEDWPDGFCRVCDGNGGKYYKRYWGEEDDD